MKKASTRINVRDAELKTEIPQSKLDETHPDIKKIKSCLTMMFGFKPEDFAKNKHLEVLHSSENNKGQQHVEITYPPTAVNLMKKFEEAMNEALPQLKIDHKATSIKRSGLAVNMNVGLNIMYFDLEQGQRTQVRKLLARFINKVAEENTKKENASYELQEYIAALHVPETVEKENNQFEKIRPQRSAGRY